MDIREAHGPSLAKLLTVEPGVEWASWDRACVLAHQLAAPLLIDLGDSAEEAPPAYNSFRDVVRAARPPRGLLSLIKRFAKQTLGDADGALPRDVATVLYYVAVAQARLCGYGGVSRLAESDLADGLKLLLQQDWLDLDVRHLFERTLERLAEPAVK
jgi:hypothetical protein